MINKSIINKLKKDVVSLEKFGFNDLTWEKENALDLIKCLMDENIGIFGGSVYKIDSNHVIPMCDNWSCEPEGNETKEHFYIRSKTKSLNYISAYFVSPDERVLFSLCFNELVVISMLRMDIKINCIGIILEGDDTGWYIRVINDSQNTGGFLIFTFNSLDPDSKDYKCFDGWVENLEDLHAYFKESSYEIEWFEY